MGGWGCPHEVNGLCQHLNGAACHPGMKGCVLFARMRSSRQLNGEASHPGAKDSASVKTPHLTRK